MSAQQFYLDMLGWAKRTQENFAEAQDAFDAWHAAGMLAPVDYATNHQLSLELTLPTGLSLPQLRAFCLAAVCEHIPKMLELLAVIDQFPRPTVSSIQRTLFGSESGGQDVPNRLRLLAAFDAVRKDGEFWRIGVPGKDFLNSQMLPALPDRSEYDVEDASDAPLELEWDDSLGLLMV